MSIAYFHPEAREEALAAAKFYEHQAEGLGRRFVEALADAVQRIEANPLLYRVLEDDIRQCRMQRFPFGVIFRRREDRIEIIAVMHLRRRPGYWKSRSDE